MYIYILYVSQIFNVVLFNNSIVGQTWKVTRQVSKTCWFLVYSLNWGMVQVMPLIDDPFHTFLWDQIRTRQMV